MTRVSLEDRLSYANQLVGLAISSYPELVSDLYHDDIVAMADWTVAYVCYRDAPGERVFATALKVFISWLRSPQIPRIKALPDPPPDLQELTHEVIELFSFQRPFLVALGRFGHAAEDVFFDAVFKTDRAWRKRPERRPEAELARCRYLIRTGYNMLIKGRKEVALLDHDQAVPPSAHFCRKPTRDESLAREHAIRRKALQLIDDWVDISSDREKTWILDLLEVQRARGIVSLAAAVIDLEQSFMNRHGDTDRRERSSPALEIRRLLNWRKPCESAAALDKRISRRRKALRESWEKITRRCRAAGKWHSESDS